MTDLFTSDPSRDSHGPRFYLIDYLVLEAFDRWNRLVSEDPHAQGDRIAERQRSTALIVASELANLGYPIELSLQFGNYSVSKLGFVKSAALEHTLRALGDLELIEASDSHASVLELTSKGRSHLKVLRPHVDQLDDAFNRHAAMQVASTGLLIGGKSSRMGMPVRHFIVERTAMLASKSSERIRADLIELGVRLYSGGAERRGYYFDAKYKVMRKRSRDSVSGMDMPKPRIRSSQAKQFA